MRYVAYSESMLPQALALECQKLGAQNVRVVDFSRQVFCDCDPTVVQRIKSLPSVVVKPVTNIYAPSHPSIYTPSQIRLPVSPPVRGLAATYSSFTDSLASALWYIRKLLSPPITGTGYTIAVLDSGIRKTHRTLYGKVVHERNFTSSTTCSDIFDHGTGVAFVAAGGRAIEGEEQGLAPGSKLMNIKVIGDDGVGTVESLILGIEEVIRLKMAHPSGIGDPLSPGLISMSLSAPDDGDPNNPIRIAVTTAIMEYGVGCVCAAGNDGPNPGTVTLPAAVWMADAVGALEYDPFTIWDKSSRGPSKEGAVKPDLMWFGTNRLVASSKSDDAFETKSGTSFSSPAIAGFGMLVREYWVRTTGAEFESLFLDKTLEEVDAIVQALYSTICRKPAGAPVVKDNDYGYGMPFGDLFSGASGAQPTIVSNMLTMTMMMTMMTKMMGALS